MEKLKKLEAQLRARLEELPAKLDAIAVDSSRTGKEHVLRTLQEPLERALSEYAHARQRARLRKTGAAQDVAME